MAGQLPEIQAPPNDGADDLAQQEKEFLAAMPKIPEIGESQRAYILELMDLRKALFWGARLFIRIVILLLIGAIFVWWWHLIGPERARWLEKAEIDHLQGLISSGAVAALVTAMGKRLLPLSHP